MKLACTYRDLSYIHSIHWCFFLLPPHICIERELNAQITDHACRPSMHDHCHVIHSIKRCMHICTSAYCIKNLVITVEVHVHERQTISHNDIYARVIMLYSAPSPTHLTRRAHHDTTRTQTESDRRSSDLNAVELKLNYLKR